MNGIKFSWSFCLILFLLAFCLSCQSNIEVCYYKHSDSSGTKGSSIDELPESIKAFIASNGYELKPLLAPIWIKTINKLRPSEINREGNCLIIEDDVLEFVGIADDVHNGKAPTRMLVVLGDKLIECRTGLESRYHAHMTKNPNYDKCGFEFTVNRNYQSTQKLNMSFLMVTKTNHIYHIDRFEKSSFKMNGNESLAIRFGSK